MRKEDLRHKTEQWFKKQGSCKYVKWVRRDVLTKVPACTHPKTKLNTCKFSQCPLLDIYCNKKSNV